jgi:D-beta-D-heptose 7-phosphate kinase/D-beta-D-heptose 1-phosphate adenosyltransferase
MRSTSNQTIKAAINDFTRLRILVIGDLILDHYIWGDVHRVSPEAPIPVLKVTEETVRAGGAANVARNLAELGVAVNIAGLIGDDKNGDQLRDILARCNIADSTITIPGLTTTCKTRLIGGHQQIARLDREQIYETSPAQTEKLVEFCVQQMKHVDAVIISDYAKGVCSAVLCQAVIEAAIVARVLVLVDPKGHDFSKYKGATLICPNLAELATVLHAGETPEEKLPERSVHLLRSLELRYLIVSMSKKGLAILDGASIRTFPAIVARSVFDVSGAGDTVIAMLAVCLASGLDIGMAARLANIAAGIVVGKIGTAPVTRTELLTAIHETEMKQISAKIADRETLLSIVAQWRSNGDKIIFTNGCFDLLHTGHLALLEEAKNEGGRLIVAVNSDASVKRLKGRNRPVLDEWDRARMLAALFCVDAVMIFDEDTPLAAIQAIQPDVLVKGGDYEEGEVVGAEEVKGWNGRVKIVPLVHDISTTNIIAKASAPVRE